MKFVIAIAVAGAAFVAGDWFELYGSRVEQTPDFIHIVFETRDDASGAPVDDVHVVCSRPMSRSVCTEKLTGIPGQTQITFAVFREQRASLLFTRPAGFSMGKHGEMTLTFIHPHYERHALLVTEDTIKTRRQQKITIPLVKAAGS